MHWLIYCCPPLHGMLHHLKFDGFNHLLMLMFWISRLQCSYSVDPVLLWCFHKGWSHSSWLNANMLITLTVRDKITRIGPSTGMRPQLRGGEEPSKNKLLSEGFCEEMKDLFKRHHYSCYKVNWRNSLGHLYGNIRAAYECQQSVDSL